MSSLDKVYSIAVDIKNVEGKYSSYAKFFDDDRDTSIIKIKLLNNNYPIDLEGCTVEAEFILANNTYHDETCKIINTSEGIVELQLCQKCLVKGENIVRLSILKDNEIANTPIITYEVKKGLYSDNPNFNDDPLTPVLSQMLLDVKVTKANQIELQERYEKSLPKIEGKIKEVESLINRVDTAIASGTQDLEVKEARVDKNGKSYAKLGDRLNEVDSQLEHKANKTFINVKDFGSKGDGITDDTISFQNAINNLSENSTLEIPEGNYIITDQLIVNKQKIRIQGKGTIVLDNKTSNGNMAIFCISDSRDIYISDLSLKTKSFQAGCAISILNKCSDITIDKVNINSFKNVGIISPLEYNNTNVKILNSSILKCKFGIAGGANGFVISNNYINNLWYESDEYKDAGKWVEGVPYYDGIIISGENFVISNNIIEGNGQSGIYTGDAKGGTISNNTIKNNYNCGLDLGIVGEYNEPNNYISNISFTGNYVYGNRHHQINITGVKNSVFTGNYVYNESNIAYPVIFTNSSSGNLVSNNILIDKRTDSNGRGVSFDSTCNNNKIIFNSIDSNLNYYRAGKNEIIDFNELTNLYNTFYINLSDLSDFAGRDLLRMIVSDDNSFGQITINKRLRLCDASGKLMPLEIGGVYIGNNDETNTYKGVHNMIDSQALYIPKNGFNVAGCIRFNNDTKKFEGYNGTTWVVLG